MATVIEVNGTKMELTDFSLKTLQRVVGGYIEVVHLKEGGLMVLDEEGKLKDKPINQIATDMTREILAPSDVIVGDVVILSKEEAADF